MIRMYKMKDIHSALPACPRLIDGDKTPAPSRVSKNVH